MKQQTKLGMSIAEVGALSVLGGIAQFSIIAAGIIGGIVAVVVGLLIVSESERW